MSNLVQKFLRILDSISEMGKKYFVKKITIYHAMYDCSEDGNATCICQINQYVHVVDDVVFFVVVVLTHEIVIWWIMYSYNANTKSRR